MFAYLIKLKEGITRGTKAVMLYFQTRRLERAKREVAMSQRAIDNLNSEVPVHTQFRENWLFVRQLLGYVRLACICFMEAIPGPVRYASVVVMLVGSLIEGREPLPIA